MTKAINTTSQDSWCKWLARKAIITTTVTVVAGASACVTIMGNVCGTKAPSSFSDGHTYYIITSSLASSHGKAVAVGAAASAFSWGLVGYLAADRFAKRILG